MAEIWKDCVGWEGLYEVSSFGSVRSKTRPAQTSLGVAIRGGNVLRPVKHSSGYLIVNLTNGKKRSQCLIHRLVLLAFVGEQPKGFQACHGNGNRHDNSLENLRWDSVKNNHADKKVHGTQQIGENNPFAKLTEEQALIVKNTKTPLKDLAKKFGVSVGCVSKVRYGQSWNYL